MTSTSTEIDPFAGGTSVPSLSFKDAPVGTVYEGTITEPPALVQSRDFDTGEPAFWPATPGQIPNPKMAAVIKIALSTGEERSVWAVKPSAMFAAIADAIKHAGKKLEVGGTLAIKYTGDRPNDNPRKAPAKQYACRYTPPVAADPFAAAPAAAVPTVAANDKGWDASPPF